jgi:four helix bundle protein
MDLMVDVYSATEEFPKQELFGLVSQLRRASVGVVSHLAEGQGRLTVGEWRQMLSQARGSLYEVQAQVIAAHRLGFLNEAEAQHLKKRARIVGKLLAGLIRWVRKREVAQKQLTQDKEPSNKQRATPLS